MEHSPIDILVLGATGFTGRLITQYLSTHPQRSSFTFAISARSAQKLDQLVQELHLDSERTPLIQVDVTRPEEVEAAVKLVKVVINTVGPYWRWGTNVVRACVRHGKHCVDLTGESIWIKEVIHEFDYFATKSGSMIINSCGMESVPSDVCAYLANQTLKSVVGPDATIDTSTTAIRIKGGGISGGTLATIIMYLEDVPREKLRYAAQDYALSPVKGRPAPRPKLLYKLPYHIPSIYGAFFLLSPTNKSLVQRTWGLLEQQAYTSAEKRKLAYGPRFVYDEFIQTSGIFTALMLSIGFAIGGLCLAWFPLTRWALKNFGPKPGEGPAPDTLDSGFIKATNVTTSIPGPGQRATHIKTVFHGRGDPGYLLSAVMISEAALSIHLDGALLPELGKKGGVLTPMSALGDVFVKRLEGTGKFKFESGILVDGESKKRK